jgi:hypothetical protein
MTLDMLRDYEPLVANEILANVAASEGGDLNLGFRFDGNREAQVAAARTEIRAKLNLAPDDVSAPALTKVSNAIFEEIKSRVLGPQGADEAMDRLGQSGEVPPHFYEPVLTDEFLKRFSGIGVSSAAVKRTICEPDRFEHIWTDVVPTPGDAVISLFLKRQPGRGATKGIWLLVQALRQGIRQVAQAAWFLFDDEFDVTKYSSLIDLLEGFALEYGMSVSLGAANGKFVREVDLPVDSNSNLTVKFQVGSDASKEFFHTFSVQMLQGKARAGVAYRVDFSRYKESLKRHNII